MCLSIEFLLAPLNQDHPDPLLLLVLQATQHARCAASLYAWTFCVATHIAYIADLGFKLLTHTPACSCHRCAASTATAAAALLVCYSLVT